MRKKNFESKKSAKIAAKKIQQKYKNFKKPKKTFLVNEENLETIAYNEPEEDLFRGESILEAANKILNFDKFKKQQETSINNFNENLLENSETINYVDDINLDDVKDNKNLKITAKKISDRYKNLRKRKATKRDQQIAKSTFDKLKTDPLSAAFAEEILDKKLLLKLKKSKHVQDKKFFNFVNLLDSKNSVIFEPDTVKRTDYVEKREIDHSTLYSFDAPFQLFHADVGNLEFLGRNATFPQYVLVLVDLFSWKVYTYPMKSRKQIRQKLEQFYRDVQSKRKGKKMKLQVDQEFQQVRIKDLNDLNNVEMFSTSIRGGKAFAAEQKIRELKTRIAKLASQKLKIIPKK